VCGLPVVQSVSRAGLHGRHGQPCAGRHHRGVRHHDPQGAAHPHPLRNLLGREPVGNGTGQLFQTTETQTWIGVRAGQPPVPHGPAASSFPETGDARGEDYGEVLDRGHHAGGAHSSYTQIEMSAMAIDRDLFKKQFIEDKMPQWPCPTCKKGVLNLPKNGLKCVESGPISLAHHLDEFEPDWEYGVFAGLLKCGNSQCLDSIIVTGDYDMDDYYIYDHEEDQHYRAVRKRLTVKHVNPSLQFFQINENVPETIRKAIQESFVLFWADVSSSANKIRIAVECLLNERKIPKTLLSKNQKRVRIDLHQRIEKFQKTSKKEGDALMAIKWIGNHGSHSENRLSDADVFDGYEMLEFVLNRLYNNGESRIIKIANDINKRKTPRTVKRVVKPQKIQASNIDNQDVF
jgi:hypothetical protein